MYKKHILLHEYGMITDLQETLNCLPDCKVSIYPHVPSDLDMDKIYEENLKHYIIKNSINICMSFNFVPVISNVCEEIGILYISWIYDSPIRTLYSPTACNSCNLIFTFDYLQMEAARSRGVHQIFHLPLAVNMNRLETLFEATQITGTIKDIHNLFSADISFVGRFYEHQFNDYEQITCLPPKLQGYLEGICETQVHIYDYNLLKTCLGTEIMNELKKYVEIAVPLYDNISCEMFFCDMILPRYIACKTRKKILTTLSKNFQTVLYSTDEWTCDNIECRGGLEYYQAMPLAFQQSCLNLNLSLLSIRSGIPLRCLDIMGAGGTLISNYQPELAEYFVPEEEWICFQGQEELLDKTAFYLSHEDLRKQIAQKGFQKVKNAFTYEHALSKIFQKVEQYI